MECHRPRSRADGSVETRGENPLAVNTVRRAENIISVRELDPRLIVVYDIPSPRPANDTAKTSPCYEDLSAV